LQVHDDANSERVLFAESIENVVDRIGVKSETIESGSVVRFEGFEAFSSEIQRTEKMDQKRQRL